LDGRFFDCGVGSRLYFERLQLVPLAGEFLVGRQHGKWNVDD
jgi:hypothetical protein